MTTILETKFSYKVAHTKKKKYDQYLGKNFKMFIIIVSIYKIQFSYYFVGGEKNMFYILKKKILI